MSGRLFRVLDRVGRHRAAASWLAGGIAALAVSGGVAAGAAGQPAPAYHQLGATETTTFGRPAATVTPGTVSLQGVVLDVRPQGFRMLTADGRTVIVMTEERTIYRKSGKPIARDGLHKGQRVVVLGRAGQNGRLRARAVVVRGEVRRPAPTPSPPGQGSSRPLQ